MTEASGDHPRSSGDAPRDPRTGREVRLEPNELLLLFRSFEEAREHPTIAAELSNEARAEALAAEFDAIESFDAAVADELEKVAIPAGLEQRILDTLTVDAGRRRALSEAPKTAAGYRHLVSWAVAACLILALGLAWWRPWHQASQPWTVPSLASKSGMWLNDLKHERWRRVRPSDLSKFRIPPSLALRPERVQIRPFDGRRGAVVQGHLARGNAEVYLFVVPLERAIDLPRSPSPRPITATSGWLVSVWQADGFVYVLRMRGTPSDYRRLIGADAPLA